MEGNRKKATSFGDIKKRSNTKKTNSETPGHINVSGVNIAWQPESGTCAFDNKPSVMMWVDSSLAGLCSGIQAMVGTNRYLLALQSEGRKSIETDWQVISQYKDFEAGFKAIAHIAAVAGWGEWRLLSLDMDKKECRFQVLNGWEGRFQKALGVNWGSGMLAGKFAGYCTKLFGTNCWADQTSFIAIGNQSDDFVVKPSSRSVEKEIENLLATDQVSRADMAVALLKLETEIKSHKRSVEALRVSEEHYRALVETTDTGYVILDGNGLVLDANKEYIRLTGRNSLYEILGKSVIDWTAEGDKEANEGAVRQCLTHGFIRNFEVTYKSPEGISIPVELNATVVRSGDQLKIVTLCRDITSRKHSEEMARNAQKLESLGVLAGGIAHDFNNFLTGIFGFIDIARLSIPQGNPACEHIDRAIAVFSRAKSLTQQLLTFSKGGMPVKKSVSIITLLKETVEFDLTGSNINPILDIKEDLWPCDADIHQIGQVLDNIVINARQAMPMGGSLEVSAHNVAENDPVPAPLKPGRYVRLSVRDFGIGIPPDVLPRIFDPFFTTKQKGSGLGLATSYSIVNKHNGHIFVESETGKGSTFTVFLPAAIEIDESREIPNHVVFNKRDHSVLVVDDQSFILETARLYLDEMGCMVNTASDGPRAIDLYQKALSDRRVYDLVILDLTIPGSMGGGAIMEKLLEIHPAVVAIVSSGYSDDPIMGAPEKFGFKAKLTKPYLREDFQKVVGTVLTQTPK
jgi:two-component system, cell cycle sensor histidine kinase and response regulator CckA